MLVMFSDSHGLCLSVIIDIRVIRDSIFLIEMRFCISQIVDGELRFNPSP